MRAFNYVKYKITYTLTPPLNFNIKNAMKSNQKAPFSNLLL